VEYRTYSTGFWLVLATFIVNIPLIITLRRAQRLLLAARLESFAAAGGAGASLLAHQGAPVPVAVPVGMVPQGAPAGYAAVPVTAMAGAAPYTLAPAGVPYYPGASPSAPPGAGGLYPPTPGYAPSGGSEFAKR
jgi:hypothetical protein